MKLLAKHWDYVDKFAPELLMVGELVVTAPTQADENIFNILEDDEEPTESS